MVVVAMTMAMGGMVAWWLAGGGYSATGLLVYLYMYYACCIHVHVGFVGVCMYASPVPAMYQV